MRKMLIKKLLVISIFVIIKLDKINCEKSDKYDIKVFETKNSNSKDLQKEILHEELQHEHDHEGALIKTNLNNNEKEKPKQRIMGRKFAIYETEKTSTTTSTPTTTTEASANSIKVLPKSDIATNLNASNATNKVNTITKTTSKSTASTETIRHKGREGVTNTNTSKILPKNVTMTTNAPKILPKSDIKNVTMSTNVPIISTKTDDNKKFPNVSEKSNSSDVNGVKVNQTISLSLPKTTTIKGTTASLITSSTTTTTTTTTSTTTTTTTSKPKKPKITYSVEDVPAMAKIHNIQEIPLIAIENNIKLPIEEQPEQPNAEPSMEEEQFHHGHQDFIIPLVLIILIVPIIMGGIIIGYRKFNDYWSTRHYRRMDFLVDGMYND